MSILVSPSSKICRFSLETLDHMLDTGSHSVFRYSIKLFGARGSVEMSSQICVNSAGSLVLTQIWTFSQSGLNALVTKCRRMARSTCHVHKNIWLCGYTSRMAASWAWSRSDIIIDGRTSGLAFFTQLRKNATVSFLMDDEIIQATGTPVAEKREISGQEQKLGYQRTVSPFVPCDDRIQHHIRISRGIVCRINADESAAKTPKCVQLELSLQAHNEVAFMIWEFWW